MACAVASLANIGGTATAPVLAGSYSSALVPVGIIMALLGYVVGTGGGLLVEQLLAVLVGLADSVMVASVGEAAVFRAMGNSGVSMRVSIIMNVINCTGNAILIYGFHRGTEGVAIPTLISRFVVALLILIMLVKTKGPIRVTPSLHFRFDGRMVRRILRIGLSNGMENSMFQLGKILVLSLVSTFGTSAIAANILIFVSLPFIMEIYHLTPQTAATTELLLRFHTICCILIWPLSFSLPCTLRTAGDTKVTMWISIISMWICRIVMSYVLGAYMGMGVFDIWVAMVLDRCVRTVFMLYRYRTGKWKLIDSIG